MTLFIVIMVAEMGGYGETDKEELGFCENTFDLGSFC